MSVVLNELGYQETKIKRETSHQKDRAVFAAEGRSREVEKEFSVDVLVDRYVISFSECPSTQWILVLAVISLSLEKKNNSSISTLRPLVDQRHTHGAHRSPLEVPV